MVPRVLRASGSTSDLAGCIAVAVSAVGWRLLEGSAASAAGALLGSAPPGSSAGDALRGSQGGSSALLSLRVAAAAAPLPPAPAPLCYPFLTVGVSNLRTAARLAAREGARVAGAGGGEPLAAGATEAVFALPGGGPALRVLHLFRRNPVVSVTLGAADAGAAAAFFEGAFGLARLRAGAGGAAEAQPRPERRSEVLAFGAPHNTTCLVVEEEAAAAAAAAAAGGGAERGALVLSVEARNVARARAAFLDKGLPTSEPGAAGSFVAMCPDGYTFHVLPAAVE